MATGTQFTETECRTKMKKEKAEVARGRCKTASNDKSKITSVKQPWPAVRARTSSGHKARSVFALTQEWKAWRSQPWTPQELSKTKGKHTPNTMTMDAAAESALGYRYGQVTTVTTGDLFENWMKQMAADDMVSSKDAKKEYFLVADDLATILICYEHGGGFGIGPPTKYYRHEDLVGTSLAKHGRAGVVKKLEARQKREEKKRMKEEKAEQARKRLKTVTNTAAVAAGDTQEIKKLRGGLLNMAKKDMGFQMSGAPKKWRIDVPDTSKATFAALLGRPTDVNLDSFVKNGAYYTESYQASKFFGTKEVGQFTNGPLTKDFNLEGVTQRIGSYVTVRYKPSTMELLVSGYAEMHSATTWFGW